MFSRHVRSLTGAKTADEQTAIHDDGSCGMWDTTTLAATAAIDGLARRIDLRAHNVANAHTPGFRALDLTFERDLQTALRRGTPPDRIAPQVSVTPSIVDERGNSVDLETELVGVIRDQLHRDALVAAFNFKVGQARAVVTGHR